MQFRFGTCAHYTAVKTSGSVLGDVQEPLKRLLCHGVKKLLNMKEAAPNMTPKHKDELQTQIYP